MKCKICLAILAAQFSEYCGGDNKFTIEQVKITYEAEPENNESTPVLQYIDFDVELSHVNRLLGINIDVEKAR
jgi:phenylalanyl-tRNA synthetase beta subunit